MVHSYLQGLLIGPRTSPQTRHQSCGPAPTHDTHPGAAAAAAAAAAGEDGGENRYSTANEDWAVATRCGRKTSPTCPRKTMHRCNHEAENAAAQTNVQAQGSTKGDKGTATPKLTVGFLVTSTHSLDIR